MKKSSKKVRSMKDTVQALRLRSKLKAGSPKKNFSN
jgi:hypothetical protein